MRVPALTAALALGAALIAAVGLVTPPARADSAEVTCPCDCPASHKAGPRRAASRPMPHRLVRHYAQATPYSYRGAAPFHVREWHGPWRAAPKDAYLPAPRRMVETAGLVIDQGGWSGGVGYGEEGGGGGGYGQVLLANGNSQNGPTYNSFGESFQQNPSMPHPFQSRLMGGLARTK